MALYESFAGNINFVGTQKTLRASNNDGDPCSVNLSGSASLSGVPAGATIEKAYLYWAGSGSGDYTVTFDGNTVTASPSRQYTFVVDTRTFFSGVADVSSIVATNPNRSYSLSNLTVTTGGDHCGIQTVLKGWALMVIYSHASEDFRVINLYEGFQNFQNSSITLIPSNFKIPVSPINGKHAHITWEGDPDLLGGGEDLTFNGTELTDATNLAGNQFNSKSTITGTPDNNSYGVDFDAYDVTAYLSAGQTSASTTYSSGQDRVLLSAEIISVTNTPVADLGIGMTFGGTMTRGTNITYTLDVSNNGPLAEAGPITVTDTLPAGLTYVSASGSGWSCGAAGQVVTCTRTGTLANGASADAITLTATVANDASGTITNSATVSGTAFDNVSGNNTALDDPRPVQGTGAGAFCEDFESGLSNWTVENNGGSAPYYGTAVIDTSVYQTGAQSLRMSRDWVRVTSSAHDLSGVSGSITYWAGQGLDPVNPDDPDNNEDLAVEYLNNSGNWIALTTHLGSDAGGTTYDGSFMLPADAKHSGFKIRFTQVAGTGNASYDYDTWHVDNVCVGMAAPLPTPYAYYAMDEASWDGTASEVKDGSGNTGRDATSVNSGGGTWAAPRTIATPAGDAKGDTCRGANIPDNNSAGTVQAVNTPVDINTLGTAGTIAFWYKSNLAWDPSGNSNNDDRTLLDATGSAAFWLVLRKEGRLRFRLRNASSNDMEAESSSFSGTAANTWKHVAITWSFVSGNRFMRIYVDGTLDDELVSSNVTSNSGYGTLMIGDTKSTTSGDNRGNSADGTIDEVRVYGGALTQTQIQQVMNDSHACASAVDHYELSLPTASVTCLPTTVTVKACADASSPCTNVAAAIGGAASLSTSAGALASSVPAYGSGVATTTLTHTAAADGTSATVTLSGVTPITCCADGTSCTAANYCSTTFKTAGFIFSDSAGGAAAPIANQVAGTESEKYYLRAVKTNTATKACESALTGTSAVNLAYQCNDPTTCYTTDAPTCGSGSGYFCLTPYNETTAQTAQPLAANPNSGVSTYTSVNMIFDADGNAPFTLKYRDVGALTLSASKAAAGSLLTGLTGNTNSFAVKPAGLTLSGIKCTTIDATNCGAGALAMATPGDNPGAAGANGVTFIRAGHPFSATVSAVASDGVKTPSFGREATAEGVTLTRQLVEPSGGNAGTLGGTFAIPGASFQTGTKGAATVADLTWNEVGVITLTPAITDGNYLGAGSVAGTASGNIGRFYPHHFALTGSVQTRSDLLPATGSTFTYMDEPMRLGLTVTAYAYAGAPPEPVTQNYAGVFAKLNATGAGSLGSATANWTCTSGSQCMGLGAVSGATNLSTRLAIDTASTGSAAPSSSWTSGVGTFTAFFTFSRNGAPNGPYSPLAPFNNALSIGGKPLDSDGVTLPPLNSTDIAHCVDIDVATGNRNANCFLAVVPVPTEADLRRWIFDTDVRYGKLKVDNASGSERQNLPVAVSAWYYGGVPNGWMVNANDALTPLPTPPFTPHATNTTTDACYTAACTSNLDGGASSVWLHDQGGTLIAGAAAPNASTGTLAAGRGSVTLTAPVLAATPTPGTLEFSLVAPPWLRTNSGTLAGAVCASAAFGCDPRGRVTFGVYGPSTNKSRFIYIRENY